MKTIDLVEETATQFAPGQLPESAAIEIERSEKFKVEFVHVAGEFFRQIRPRGWVGHIPINNELLVRVTPKVPIDNIFRMLEVAYQLKSFQFFDGQTNVEHLNDAIERLAAILAREFSIDAERAYFELTPIKMTIFLCARPN